MIVILTLARLRSWLNHDGRCRAAGAESTDPVWEVGAGVADPSQVRPDAEALLGHYQEAEQPAIARAGSPVRPVRSPNETSSCSSTAK